MRLEAASIGIELRADLALSLALRYFSSIIVISKRSSSTRFILSYYRFSLDFFARHLVIIIF
jgi:hypothetical protein